MDAVKNAALEEQLYRNGDISLLFYRNAPSVIIGRNQNPFKEVCIPWCAKHNIPIIRRISGGGAVYHDSGNLNYAFIVPKKECNYDDYVGIAVAAINNIGIGRAEISGQHGIFIDGLKCSGSAFAVGSQVVLVHGCILVDTDLDELHEALRQPTYEFHGRSVESVRAHVTNLTRFVPSITTEILQNAIIAEAEKKKSLEVAEIPQIKQETAQKYSDDLWNYGNTPAFTVVINGTPFHINKGRWP